MIQIVERLMQHAISSSLKPTLNDHGSVSISQEISWTTYKGCLLIAVEFELIT